MNDLKNATRIGFGLFEADLRSGELWKAGRKVKLQTQPFKLLTALVEKPGEVVTREELHTRLWGKDATGDFDQSLGTAVKKIREALGDTADNPRFVETLARRGYRWIAPVLVLGQDSPPDEERDDVSVSHVDDGRETDLSGGGAGASALLTEETPVHSEAHISERATSPGWSEVSRSIKKGWAGSPYWTPWIIVPGTLLIGFALWLWKSSTFHTAPLIRMEQVTRMSRIAPGMLAMENLPAGVTDGQRLYIPVLLDGRTVLNEVNARSGDVQPISVPSEIESPTLGDLSPDGSTILLRSHLSPESEQPFWLLPTSGGSALRLPNAIGHDATWMPDGKSVLLASGNQLTIQQLDNGASRHFATVPGRAFWLRWSPDGALLRFTLLDPIGHTMQLGEIRRDGTAFRMLLNHWSEPASECCGVWAGNGRSFVFQSVHGNPSGSSDLWRLKGKEDSGPVRVTDGPMSYVAPISSRDSGRIYFLGLETQSSLEQFDGVRNESKPVQAFLADAARIEYSRDHLRVTWTDQAGRQWRARADGSDTIRLTPDSMQVFLGRWSPDGRRIALMAREPGKAWRIYIMDAAGGRLEALLDENRNEADPSWSQDGKQIVFGRIPDVMGKEEGPRNLEIFDLSTHTLTPVPNSAGVFSPRWSPNGRYIAALSLDQRRLVLFDTTTGGWRTLADTTAADPVWSGDGKAIFFHASLAEFQPIYRFVLETGALERVSMLSGAANGSTADSYFCGLTPEDVPIVRTRKATGNLYSMNLEDH